MKRRIVAFLLSGIVICSLTACGGSQTTTSSSVSEAESVTEVSTSSASVDSFEEEEAEPTPEPEEEYDPMVESIDVVDDNGELKYIEIEKAAEGLCDEENIYVMIFEYTNFANKPAEVQSSFDIQFFQNGAELNDNFSYSSTGGEQYDLVGSYFDDAMKGGTVTFGRLAQVKDDSPITIMVTPYSDEDAYQMMEVSLKSKNASKKEETSVNAEDLDAAIQGTWILESAGASFTFDADTITVVFPNGDVCDGSYTVNTDASKIDATITATDGMVNLHLDYTYSDGQVVITNNSGEAFVKQ